MQHQSDPSKQDLPDVPDLLKKSELTSQREEKQELCHCPFPPGILFVPSLIRGKHRLDVFLRSVWLYGIDIC